ncbi:MAG: hypothetical protein VB861_07190, partial [Planctomycetaceae bacterium]
MDLHKYSKVEERIIRALDDETEFEFVDLPLTDVVEYLKQQHNIQIILDETALLDEGIQPDEPINMSLSGISLGSALKIILKPLTLTYVIQYQVMRITTETRAEEIMTALRRPPPNHKYSKVEERIIRALDDETEFEFVDLPLTDVVEYLKQQHNIQIILDEQALLDEGIQPDEPINMSLSGISLRSALKIILEPLALTYVIQYEVMRITTETRAEEIMTALRRPPPNHKYSKVEERIIRALDD